MKLSASNIAWPGNDVLCFLDCCADNGCKGVELAINKIWNEPTMVDGKTIKSLTKAVNSRNLNMIGFHSLLYTRPDLKLFESKYDFKKTSDYILLLGKLCKEMGGSQLVLGSPVNRQITKIEYSEAWNMAVEGFGILAEKLSKIEIKILIEALRPIDTNFIVTLGQAIQLTNDVNHSNFRMVVDAGATAASKKDILDFPKIPIEYLEHFHVNDEGLTPPGTRRGYHNFFADCLLKMDYSGYLSIEMLSPNDSIDDLIRSFSFVKEKYCVGLLRK